MEIILADHAGFCYGVKRALRMADQAVEEGKGPLATLGPIIHNPQVVERLKTKGIDVVNHVEEMAGGKVIIRSHGVTPTVYEEADVRSLKVVDATCPFVTKAQKIARDHMEKGYQVVVVGDTMHPEIIGIVGWTDGKAWVVESADEARQLPSQEKMAVLAQTTLPEKTFQAVVEILGEKSQELAVHNTICSATAERQEAALRLAQTVQVMIVVGGRESSNTRKLAKLCQDYGTPTYHIETASELQDGWFDGVQKVGVTAGASTPDWIIEEVIARMSDMNMDQDVMDLEEDMDMEASLEESFRKFEAGSIITGAVVKVSHDEILLDVGGKSEGVIPRKEFSHRIPDDLTKLVKVGDELECVVVKGENEDGNILLSRRRVEQRQAVSQLQEALETGNILEGEVISVVKGGLLVDVGIRGFLPASLVDRGYVENLEPYVGQQVRVKVIEVDTNKGRAVLSRKAALMEELAKVKEETWATLQEGQIRKGTVRRLADFGAFIDLGGVDGLLHVSEMSWSRIKHPSQVVKEGDEVEVYVLKADRDAQKVSLSLKGVLPNPWTLVKDKYPEGSTITVKVVRLTPFGAFCELEPGIDGLIHISQMADRRVNKPEDVVSIGQELQVKVLEIKDEEQRISLSIRALFEDKEQAEAQSFIADQQEDTPVTIGETVEAKEE